MNITLFDIVYIISTSSILVIGIIAALILTHLKKKYERRESENLYRQPELFQTAS
jgi:hypothetical protein